MSYNAKDLRSARKSKAQRLVKADPSQKVDSSDWTPPEPLNADVKTGMRPVSRRAFKKGGKVIAKVDGKKAMERADRKPRLSGGKINSYLKKSVDARKKANDSSVRMQNLMESDLDRDDYKAYSRHGDAAERYGDIADRRDKGIKMATDKIAGRSKVPARATGGKVEKKGEQPLVDRWINRDNKKANEYRDGKKHVGGMKSGGRTKKLGGGEVGANPVSEQSKMMGNAAMPQRRKAGGRTKKADGGRKFGEGEAAQHAKAERNMYDGFKKTHASEKIYEKMVDRGEDPDVVALAREELHKNVANDLKTQEAETRARRETGYGLKKGGAAKHPDVKEDKALIKKMVKPSAIKKASGGGLSPFEKAFAEARKAYLSGKGKRTFSFTNPKTGKTSEYTTDIKKSYSEPSTRGRGKTATRTVEKTTVSAPPMSMSSGQPITEAQRMGKAVSREANAFENYNDAMSQEGADTAKAMQDVRRAVQDVGQEQMRSGQYKKGGRLQRKSGGRTKKGKGKTHINIVIATGGKNQGQDQSGPPMMPPPGPSRGPGAAPVPMPMPPAGAAPMPMPPSGAGGPPVNVNIPPATMQRKHGGKVYRSYKDMDAGAGSGEGRLEKTEIAARARSARKAGGKVYRSYKDMDAGSGSGEGRLEKTEIEKRKRLH